MSDDTMAVWETAFAETGNPLFAQRAALQAWARGERPPAWAEKALANVAIALLTIECEYQHGPRDADAAKHSLKKVPAAIGLSKPGWNAFVAAADYNRDVWTAVDCDYAWRFERKEEARVELVAKWRKISPSQVRKRVKRAKKLGLARD